MVDFDPAEEAAAQSLGYRFAIVAWCGEHETSAQRRAVLGHLIGDPLVDGRTIRCFVRHAKVETVNGLRGHISLQGSAMFSTARRSFGAHQFPCPRCEMIGVIRVGMDVVDFVGNEIIQLFTELLITRGK